MKKTAALAAFALAAMIPMGALGETVFAGEVTASNTQVIAAPFGGMVEKVSVRVGDSVKIGDPIAVVETTKVYAETDGTVSGVTVYEQKLNDKLISVKTQADGTYAIELEKLGVKQTTGDMQCYSLLGTPTVCQISDLTIGYAFSDFVLNETGKIVAALLVKQEEMEQIRVLLKTDDFAGAMHETVSLHCDTAMDLLTEDGTGELKEVQRISYSDGLRSKVNCYGANDVREGVAIMWKEGVDVSITGNSTNPTRFQHPVAGTYKKECIEAGKKYFSVASGGGTGRTLHPDNMAAGPASYGMTDTLGRMHSDAQFAGSSSVPAHVEMMGLIGAGNNPMVGMTVAVAVAIEESAQAGKF